MEGGRIRPSYGQGRYGVVQSKAPDIACLCVLDILLHHHTIGRRRPWRFPPNAFNVVEQGDNHCESEPSRCVLSWQRTFRSGHQGVTGTPLRVGWEGGVRNGG